ncbi:MAG TPA: YtxH domain-containing protein [Gemmatimonadales bacterium]|nr:YtxH domain-containing protein [Gemmatimonadales bacterium]
MAEDENTSDVAAERTADDGRSLGGFAAGLLVGAMLGAGLALMFAPERGDRTRRRLRRRLERLREDTSEGLGRAGALTRRELLRRREGR